MKAVDSSVAVRALLSDAEDHVEARAVVSDQASIPLHAVIETFSTLTRIPEPARLQPEVVTQLLHENFGDRVLPGMSARSVMPWIERLAGEGIRGGAIYDALVAESPRATGATLVTADARAAATYRAVGVDVQMLGD